MPRRANRIVLAVCGYETVPFRFLEEYHRLRSASAGYVATTGVYVEQNRNQAVRWALESRDWDYLLFVDPDMTFPSDLMDRVRRYSEPVVGGLYFRRTRLEPVVGTLRGDEPLYDSFSPEELLPMLEKPGLYPADALATGCLAIRRDVLEDWPADLLPIFRTIPLDESFVVGEDTYFCWRLKQQGIEAFLDTNVCCTHHGTRVVDKDAYLNETRRSALVGS